MSSAVVGNYM